MFQCNNTVCVRNDEVCDGSDDCSDGTDEDGQYNFHLKIFI